MIVIGGIVTAANGSPWPPVSHDLIEFWSNRTRSVVRDHRNKAVGGSQDAAEWSEDMSTLEARIVIDPDFVVGPVRRAMFGAFVEHLGRCVYTGIFEPEHPQADEHGFRRDTLDLVRELGVSTIRYPGGNFVSGYRWEDGIGPRDDRPRRRDLAWHCTEPNAFGTDEFLRWAEAAGVVPMLAINLGTRGVQEALDLLEYCNGTDTALADRRRANGRPEPYDVRLWCLGNEMDGPWQIGHKTANEYGRIAAETARAMRMFDPDLTLVACGSSGPDMATFGAWEAAVLAEAYDEIDLLSAHCYFREDDGDLASFLASGVRLDRFLDDVSSTADHVRAVRKARKRIGISVDEWNVWYQGDEPSRVPIGEDWPVAPRLLEDRYSLADAVVVGGLLISLLRHSDRVESACLAQLVNVIAPIITEPGGSAWRQTTFHPFAQTSRLAAGVVLATRTVASQIETPGYGPVDAVDSVATWDADRGRLVLFVVNRSPKDPVQFSLRTGAFGAVRAVSAQQLCDENPYRVADLADPDPIGPKPIAAVLHDGSVRARLAPVSWNVIEVGFSAGHDSKGSVKQ
jgi:alpha-N-arabinofuranosidase